jgi:hypothetical protein
MALACAVAVASPAGAVAPVAPAALVVRPGDLPGFAGATVRRLSTSSAASFAEEVLEPGKGAILKREGFTKGVLELLTTRTEAFADSTTGVFRSAHGAKQLLRVTVSSERKELGDGKRFTVAGIPGSFGVRERTHRSAGAGDVLSTGVFFSTGRCFLLILTVFHSTDSTATPGRVNGGAVAGATALYRRVKRLCR